MKLIVLAYFITFFQIITKAYASNSSKFIFVGFPIGAPCDDPAECVGQPDKSECKTITDFNRCWCKDQYVAQNDLMDCLPIQNEVGQECLERQQCTKGWLKDFSDCIDSECHCIDSAVKDPLIPECLLKSNLVDDLCQSSLQCQAKLGYLAVCLDSHCQCLNSVPRSNRTKCLPLATLIGGECEETSQCTAGTPGRNSKCVNFTCQCDPGYVNPELGETCLPEKLLNEPCTDNKQCTSTLGELALCQKKNGADKGSCKCNEEKAVPNMDLNVCLPLATNIGSVCQVDQQCQQGLPGTYSRCLGKLGCQCTEEAVYLPGSSTCHKKADIIGEPCQFLAQCTANLGNLTECYLGTCECTSEAVSNGLKCFPGPVLIGHECQDNVQCVANALCTETRQCGCIDKYVPNSLFDKCLPVQDLIGGHCEEQIQCWHGMPGNLSECRNYENFLDKVCNCTDEAVARPEEHHCYRKAKFVGDFCEFDEQCAVPLGYSRCYGNTCICSQQANPSSDGLKCVLKVGLGQPCTDDGQCSHIPQLGSASCVKTANEEIGQCQCNSGHVENPDFTACLKMAEFIGDTCQYPLQCEDVIGSNCMVVNGTRACHCDYFSEVANGQRNKCLKTVLNLNDGICEESVQCVGTNAECIMVNNMSQCRCNNVTTVEGILNRGKCIQIVKEVNQPCQEDIQCTKGIDDFAECRNLSCQCSVPYEHYNGHCYISVGLGGNCNKDEECHLGSNNLTRCSSPQGGQCVCQETAFERERICWENKRVGDACENDRQCTISILGESRCNLGKCICSQGQRAQLDNRFCAAPSWLSSPVIIFILFLISLSLH